MCGLGKFISGQCTGRPDLWIRDMGGDPPNWEDPGGVTPPGGTTDGREEMKTYISRLHNIVAQYIANRTIFYLCMEVERRPGSRVSRRW